jgi:hypothetical protein
MSKYPAKAGFPDNNYLKTPDQRHDSVMEAKQSLPIGHTRQEAKMRIIALLFSRFSRHDAQDIEAFDQRLRNLDASRARGRTTGARHVAPHLFRRGIMGHA